MGIKKVGIGSIKVVGTAVLGATGILAGMVEGIANAGDNPVSEIAAEVAYHAKNKSLNKIRSMWGKEEKQYGRDNGKMAADFQNKQAQVLDKCMKDPEFAKVYEEKQSMKRQTDEEIENNKSDLEKKPYDFQYRSNVPLSTAIDEADAEPGIYVIMLKGEVMKCGRATYEAGVRWRLRQYYNLSYDNRSRKGDLWAINKENVDDIIVSWQCCPVSKCKELEARLSSKHNGGAWSKRSPSINAEESWPLLI